MMVMEVPAFPWLEPEAGAGEMVALRNVFLHVTKACNLRCDYGTRARRRRRTWSGCSSSMTRTGSWWTSAAASFALAGVTSGGVTGQKDIRAPGQKRLFDTAVGSLPLELQCSPSCID